jgi:hypothetical protein
MWSEGCGVKARLQICNIRFKGVVDSDSCGWAYFIRDERAGSPSLSMDAPSKPTAVDGEEIETGCELKGLPLRRTSGRVRPSKGTLYER